MSDRDYDGLVKRLIGPQSAEVDYATRTEAAAAIRELRAERDRLRDALRESVKPLAAAQECLNGAADDQQDKHGNVMGAASLRALRRWMEISCIQSSAALATPPKSGT